LAVSHAFHSRIVAPAQEPLRRVLHKLHISAPKYPIYTNITGTLYPETPDAIIDIMAEQLARPVEFIQEIENMYADGARIFIEVGPKRALTGMIRNILDTRPHLALACNHPKKNDLFALMETLAALRTHHLQWRVPSTKSSTTALARPSEKTLAYRPPAKEELVISSWSLLAGSSKSSQMDMSTWRPVLQQLLREAGVPTGEATLLPDAWQKDTGLMWLMPHAHRQFAFLSSMTASLGILGPQMHLPTDFLAGNEGMLWSMDWLRSRRCRRVLVVERYEDAWGVLLLERAEDLLHRGCHAQAALLPDFSGTRQDWQEELKLQLPEFCAQPFADEQMSSPSHILLLGQAPTRKPSLTKAGGGGGMAAILALQQFQQQPDLDLCLHCVPQLASQMAVMTYRCLQRDHESRIADRQKHGHFIEALQASNTSLLHWSEQALLPSPQDADLPLASTFATRLQEVTALFADHTGYQIDDLLPDYQLEADLGIDTVKQAELLSVLRDRYPALADRLTGELTTLRQIAQALVLEPVQEQPLAEQPMAANTAVSQEISIVREEAESASSDWEDKALTDWLLELFAQHTGYEKADLGLDYALEGDLGIDTVKQAEILSLVRQRYALASDKPLAAFPTIRAILAALKENHLEASSLTEHSQTSTATQALSPVQPSNITIQSVRLQKIKAPEGRYPIEGKSVVVVANSTNAQKGLLVELQAMAAEVMRYYTWAEALAQPMEAWAKCELLLMVLPDAQEAFHPEHSQAQVLEAIALTQRLGQSHRGAAKMPDIFVLGLNGGGFGCGSAKPQAWALAGVAGMLKTLAKEWPKSRCLVLDWVEGPANPSLLEWQFIARQLFAVASVADVCEIAYADSAFWLPRRIEQTEHPIQLNSFTLQPADVVVATGGSQGVTFKILEQMALSGPFKLILCGRTRAVRPEESWFANAKDDSERYQHAKKILESRGERTTPAAVRAYVAAEQARLDIYNNQMRLQSLGCELHFYPIDVTNTARLDTLQKTILNHHGSVRLLIHGAGIEESKYLIDKTLPTMQMVLAVKAQAAWQMWETLQPDRMITMGSVSARYGNAGQADYAAANEMMAAMARTANINGDKRQWLNIGWSAWKDIGMATRGSVQQVLEGMGVELINLQEGVRLAASLIQSHWTHDVVVAGHLGSFNRSDFVPLAEEPQTPADRPLFDHMNQTPQGGLLAMHRSGLDTHPALHDHRIDGTPVFPGVWGLALMKAAVAVVFAEPERGVCVLEQVEFMRPIKFFKDEPLDIWLEATPVQDGQTTLRVFTYFSDPTGRKTQHEHYRARARWQLEYPPNMRDMQQSLTATRAHSITPAMLYERYFHGKAFQVLSHIDALTDTSVAARPDITIEWSIAPHMQQALLGVEAGFQLCGLWQMLESREVCLPSAIEQVVWPMGQVTVGRIAIEEDLACETPQFCIRVESCNPAEASTDGIYLSGYRTRWWRPLAIQEHFSGEDYTPSLQKTGQIRLNETTQSLHEQESENYLSPSEWAEYQAFTFDKRRTEWLAARILAKKILQHVAQRYFSPVDLKAISLTKDAHGKPQWTGPYAWLSDCQLSLSHTEDWVWVVLNWQHGCYVGIDVEKVTERHPRFALDYLTPGEQAMAALAAEQSHVLHTQLWACKEAYMKALGLGARLSFTDIEVLLDTTPIQVHLVGEAKRRFVDLHIVGSDVHLTTYTKQHESTHVVASVCLYTEPTQQRLFSDTVASGAQSLCQ
jgi:phosphopantetheinyl transferase/NAD(P)-dependent dehydrogenase (short-subunit alcohol dehydrogenase family)